jgi:hypothetical protein
MLKKFAKLFRKKCLRYYFKKSKRNSNKIRESVLAKISKQYFFAKSLEFLHVKKLAQNLRLFRKKMLKNCLQFPASPKKKQLFNF